MESRQDEPGPSGELLAGGARLGRYVVLGALGQGGMGVVYAAHDPELDRKVAIKLLRPGVWGDEAEGAAQARMQREAQAMARLAHPNVVAVHDVGMFDKQVFIAMEFVEGLTLNRWLHERPRPWREVVEVFQQAGRGLAAAHAAGLVHRDFKPGNVMVGHDGRVRVFDFGLARALLSPESAGHEGAGIPARSEPNEKLLAAPLTRPGAWMGTPEYMAPEQLRGRPADALSDQFSFCAALHEAVYGERAFPGEAPSEVASAIVLGVTRAPPNGSRVPSWIRAVVMRGVHTDPALRFPSMAALVRTLERDPAAARRRNWLLAALALAVLAGALSYWNLHARMSAAESARAAKPIPRHHQATFVG